MRVAHSQSIKEFKIICKTQKGLFWDKKIQNLKLNCKDNVNKNFWNIWKDFQEDIIDISLPQKDGSVWENYYKNLFNLKITDFQKSKDLEMLEKYMKGKLQNTSKLSNKNLSRNISSHELKTVVKRLKMGKATGLDKISNEMI